MEKVVKIRGNSFETNSSSSHSVYVGDGANIIDQMIEPNDNNEIHIYLKEFGWEWKVLYEPTDKLVYVASSFYDDEDKLNGLKELVKDVTGADLYIHTDHLACDYGLIDHQSYGILSDVDVTIKEIIFSSECVIVTGNDNDSVPEWVIEEIPCFNEPLKYEVYDIDNDVVIFQAHDLVEDWKDKFVNLKKYIGSDIFSVAYYTCGEYLIGRYPYTHRIEETNDKYELDVPFEVKKVDKETGEVEIFNLVVRKIKQ